MVQKGGGDSSFDATPMNTCLPSSKRLVEESCVDDHGPVKKLKLVDSDTTTFDPNYPKAQVHVTNSRPEDACQNSDSPNPADSGAFQAVSDVTTTGACSGDGLSTATPTVTSSSEALSPSVVSPLQNENGDSIANGTSSSQSRITTVSLEAKVKKCEEAAHASVQASVSTEGSSEVQPARSSSPPLKSTKMSHLKRKYTGELEYMLREFRKLERQLLGAKGNVLEESAGSRERREKLHSFIIHLEGTIREIEVGCQLESQGKSIAQVGADSGDPEESKEQVKKKMSDSSALTNLTREKEEEENVQKLEEHILANLLPVKVRLKKQLAAQQGASQNPAGMPARRGSLVASTTVASGTTFAAAAEQRRKAEAARVAATAASTPTSPASATMPSTTVAAASKTDGQFSNPLAGGGSSLTQKLLGSTSGPSNADSRGQQSTTSESNASPADKSLIPATTNGQNPPSVVPTPASQDVTTRTSPPVVSKPPVTGAAADASVPASSSATAALKAASTALKMPVTSSSSKSPLLQKNIGGVQASAASALQSDILDDDCDDLSFSEEERKRMRKRKRKKKQRRERSDRQQDQRDLLLHQQAVQAANAAPKGAAKRNNKTQVAVPSNLMTSKGQTNGKKKGPRTVEYICALCSESYNSTCEYNPWWALVQHECPKCRKTQVPRVDISSPANAIEYHPALLASADDTGGGGGGNGAAASAPVTIAPPTQIKPNQVLSTVAIAPVESAVAAASPPFNDGFYSDDSDSGSELSDELLLTDASDDDSFMDSDDSDLESFLQSFSPGEQAENESFGFEYTGPKFTDSDAARLLILIDHASTCQGRHKLAQHREVCRSTKFLMLHVRDCPGTTSTFDVCPFPWCRKTKHILYHLVSCTTPAICSICSPSGLSKNFVALRSLNEHRRKKQRERMLAASAVARCKALSCGTGVATAASTAASAKTYALPVNTKPQHPQRQLPTTTPKIISTSIKPISGQRPTTSLAPGQSSSILQRPKASPNKVVAKSSALTALVPTAAKASLISQAGTAPCVPTTASAYVSQPAQSSVPAAPPSSANQVKGTSASLKVEEDLKGTASLTEYAGRAVPDTCASTCNPDVPTVASDSAQIGVPGKASEKSINVAAMSANGPLTVSPSPLNPLSNETVPCKSHVLHNESNPLSKTEALSAITGTSAPSGVSSIRTSEAAEARLNHNSCDIQVSTPTDSNSCVDASIQKPQITLPVVKTERDTIGSHEIVPLQQDAAQVSHADSAIEDVKTQTSETVKVGC